MKNISVLIVALFIIFGPAAAYSQSAAGPESQGLIISEVLANAVNESSGEYIEIYNDSDNAIDLADWLFEDASGLQQNIIPLPQEIGFGFSSTEVDPYQIALILDKDYTNEYNQIVFTEIEDPDSTALMGTSSGNLMLNNSSEEISIYDENGSIVDSVDWNSDLGEQVPLARKRSVDTIYELEADPDGPSPGFLRETQTIDIEPSDFIRLSELLPAPTNGDEFIEIENIGATPTDLSGYSLRDASGKTYALSGILAGQEYLVVNKAASGIALNNGGDTIELVFGTDPNSQVIDSATYANAPSDQSWSLINDEFVWTDIVTPGAKNIINSESDENNNSDPDKAYVKIEEIKQIQELEEGSPVEFAGVTATELGLFYKESFHVVDESAGILVKLTEEESIDVGTLVIVRGELDIYQDMPRIEAEQITIEKTEQVVPLSNKKIASINSETIGQLVSVQGEVTRRSGKSFRIRENKEDVLVSVRKGSKINDKAPLKRSSVQVAGIVLRSGEQLVVAPRQKSDIRNGQLVASGTQTSWLIWVSILAVFLGLTGYVWLFGRRRPSFLWDR